MTPLSGKAQLFYAEVDEGTYPAYAHGASKPNVWIHRNCGTTDEYWITYAGNDGQPFQRFHGTGADQTLTIHPYPAAGTHCGNILTFPNAVAFRDWVSNNSNIYDRPPVGSTGEAIAALDCHHYVMDGGDNGPGHATHHGLFQPGTYRVFQDGAANASAFVWRPEDDQAGDSVSIEVWRLLQSAFDAPPFNKPNPNMANPTTLQFVEEALAESHADIWAFRNWTHEVTENARFEEHHGSFYWID